MIRLGGLLTLIALGVWLYAIFDSLTAPAERVRHLPKAVWVLIVLLFADLGAIAWFFLGRPRRHAEAGSATAAAAPRPFGWQQQREELPQQQVRRLAPDDDPDFLRHLDEQLKRNPREE